MPSSLQHKKSFQSGFSLIEVLLAIVIVAVLGLVLSVGASSVSEKARNIECLSNLKSLGGGFHRYAVDHNGMLPIRSKPVNSSTPQQWHREMWPSYRAEGDTRDWAEARNQAGTSNYKRWPFHCPADRDPTSTLAGLSYAANVQLTDARISQLNSRQILLIELKNNYMADGSLRMLDILTRRHGSLNHILFADYHIETLTHSQFPTAAQMPEAWKIIP